MAELTPKAQEAMEQIQLMQGEEAEYCIQADGFFAGSNPIQKVIATLQAKLVKLTGGHIRVFLVLTNMRVLMIQSQSFFCGANRLKAIHTISSSSIVEAGTAKDTKMCCVHTRMVHIESMTQTYGLAIQKLKDEDLKEFLTRMSMLIIANAQGGYS